MASFDLFVIGGGSGGVACARRAASHGAGVALAEPNRLGGTCVNRGCVPKKLMSYAAAFGRGFETARGYGWGVAERPKLDFRALLANRNREVERLNGIYGGLLRDAGVEILRGRATLRGRDKEGLFRVEVEGRHHAAKRVLIATGGHPACPNAIEGLDLAVTSDFVYEQVYDLPAKVAVVGGGYIGLESASILAGLGAEATVIMRQEKPLRGFDEDVRRELTEQLEGYGLRFMPSAQVSAVERDGDGLCVVTERGRVAADMVINATGRLVKPMTDGIGLDEIGVHRNQGGAVLVQGDTFESSVPGLFAVGDCSDHGGHGLTASQYDLTPVAIAEGRAVAEGLFNDNPIEVAYDTLPTAVFCTPQVGSCGMSEATAKGRGLDVRVYTTRFRPMLHALSGEERKTFMKVVVDADCDRVVGCFMVGDEAGEIIQGLAVAMTAGATKAEFDRTVGVHPSAAEEFVTLYQPRKG
ncbi:MAG: glutathione-disulfide reductase [Geminicoccaceae bacterium]|nr:glutathione-disulfide reductase [Geminicoccaceae bacterium]